MKELLYQRIARVITGQIKNGVYVTGDKLPSLRTVCDEFGVSMNTSVQAYLELEKNGLIISRPQSGFYVTFKPGRLKSPKVSCPVISPGSESVGGLIAKVYQSLNDKEVTRFSLGVPENELLPIAKLNKSLVEAMRSLSGGGTAYDEIQGNYKLRRDVAKYAYNWGGTLTADDIVTTFGAMNSIALALMSLTERGDVIAVESPVYFGILQLAESLGLQVLELPTYPRTGIDPDALKAVVQKIKVCLLVSNFNNPLGSCMPDEHKREVVQLLSENGVPLIEDDLYGDVYFGNTRPKPCKAFDEAGTVLWCGSVSKTLAPGYRVGWIAPGKFKEKIVHQKLIHTVSTTSLTQEAIAYFLEVGKYEQHLRYLRNHLHGNSLQFIRAIGDYFPEEIRVTDPQGGFMLWLELDKKINTNELYERAMRQNISIAPGRMFSLQEQFTNCLRLSYGQIWNERIEDKLSVLGKIIKGMM